MTLVEMIELVAANSLITKEEASSVIRNFLECTFATLKSGESVKLHGYGVFHVVTLKPRTYFKGKKKSGTRQVVRFRQTRKSKWKSTQSSLKTK